MMMWKRLSSQKVFSHPRLDIYEDDVKLPDGHTINYLHFGDMPDAVMIIPINDEGKILIQEEYSYPVGAWVKQFPGGGAHQKEAIQAAAKRELQEEANLDGDLQKIGWFYTDNRRKKQRMHVFVATNLKQKVGQRDLEETFREQWCTKEEIVDFIKTNKLVVYTALAGWALYLNTNVKTLDSNVQGQ